MGTEYGICDTRRNVNTSEEWWRERRGPHCSETNVLPGRATKHPTAAHRAKIILTGASGEDHEELLCHRHWELAVSQVQLLSRPSAGLSVMHLSHTWWSCRRDIFFKKIHTFLYKKKDFHTQFKRKTLPFLTTTDIKLNSQNSRRPNTVTFTSDYSKKAVR